MLMFLDDYSEGAHPAVLEALVAHNGGQEFGYGEDRYSRLAAEAGALGGVGVGPGVGLGVADGDGVGVELGDGVGDAVAVGTVLDETVGLGLAVGEGVGVGQVDDPLLEQSGRVPAGGAKASGRGSESMKGSSMYRAGPVVPKMLSIGACRFWAPSVSPTQVATTQLGVYAMYHAST
jgi:hypothetical protein